MVRDISLLWLEETAARGVRERSFMLDRVGRRVPGVLWTPDTAVAESFEGAPTDGSATGDDGASERPLVLVGHGASGNKREDYVVSLARRLVRHLGYAVVAIDGPVHGDRRRVRPGVDRPELPFLDFTQLWAGDAAMTDEMVADWRAVIDARPQLSGAGSGPVGYWGLSMGTILGLPFVAAEPRVEAAVLGLMGMTGPTRERIAADAPAVSSPVLFLVQWDDEIFDRDRAFELFEALGSSDKRLHAHPGRHGEVPVEELEATEDFFAARLGYSRPDRLGLRVAVR